MKELTQSNHFKFGYNNEWFNFRKSSKDIWRVKYGRCSREPQAFKAECLNVIDLINQSTQLPINIFFSGGIDSEVVVRLFFEKQIPFTCVICEFENGYNQHDIKYAIKLCNELSIPFKIITIDVEKFWKENLYKRAFKTRCISPQLPVIMWMIEQVDGYNIICNGECFLVKENGSWFLLEKEKISSWMKHYILHDLDGTSGFFQYTPEVMLSFLEHPIMKNSVENGTDIDTTYPLKGQIYKSFWDIEEREKYNGFEHLSELDQQYRQKLERVFPGSNSIVKTEYYHLIDMLAPVEVKEITKEEISKYSDIYEKEGLSIFKTPFTEIDYSCYFAAYIRGKISGLTSFDVLKNKQIYQHAALTLPRYRRMGINNIMWKYKMDKIKEFANEDTELISINPDWIPGAKIMGEKLQRIGFKIYGHRPDGAKFLKAKFWGVCNV